MYYPGTILIWGAFLLGLASTVCYALAIRGDEGWRRLARQTYVLMTAAVVVASAVLMYLLLTHDYRVFYVTAYTDNSLPLHFLISAFWAGQEGSFLLWVFWAAVLGLPLMRFARDYEPRVMFFYNLTLLSLVLLLVKQDPFRFHQGLTASMVPLDGNGLNPLLQNPWMVIHPPVMFLGYACLAVPFAFALAALWMRRYDDWARVSLPWVLLSLLTLGAAIMLGGYWSYETLGWGGYWGWDPVENASLVPWLATAALAHGLVLQRGKHRFRRLNLVLAIFSYLLVVYATFLTRSGVLANFSVHSFVDLGITGWLVFNMAFFLLVSVGLLVWRWREIPTETGDEPFLSRTVFFVLGVIVLVGTGLMVLIGTSAPLITRLWMEKPAQVGPDFYNTVGLPLAILFSVGLGIIPFLGWQRAREGAGRKLAVVIGLSLAATGAAAALGAHGWLNLLYIGTAAFSILANVWAVIRTLRRGRLAAAGGYLSHVGVGVMILAFLVSGVFDRSEKVRLPEGEAVDVMGYTMTFKGIDRPTPDAHDAMVVDVRTPSGKNLTMRPLMWVNEKTNQLVANPDIEGFFTHDLYLAPEQYDPGEDAPVSGRLVLAKGETGTFRDWKLTFEGFDLSSQHAVPGAFTVGVVVTLERPGEQPVRLEPSVVSSEGGATPVPVPIPGTPGGAIRIGGMDASRGLVRLELLGLGGGIARDVTLAKGESFRYGDLTVRFEGFEMAGAHETGNVQLRVPFAVVRDGETVQVVASVHERPDGTTEVAPAAIPGAGGMTLDIGRIDAENGRVEVRLFDPRLRPRPLAPPSLVLDVSVKPLIGLVWIGTILTTIGIFMALLLRRRDLAVVPIPTGEGRGTTRKGGA